MNTALQIRETALPLGSLDSYVHWANRIPLLSYEEEQSLAYRFRDYADVEAARKLVMAHLRFVVKVAKNYAGYGLPQADLIQEGNIGLMKAVKHFDPTLGVRLVSFAIHWIKAEIHEFVLRNWRIVKVATTKAQRKLFFNLRRMSKKIGWLTKDETQDIANELNVSSEEVVRMEQRLRSSDESMDTPVGNDADSGKIAPIHYLEDPHANPAEQLENADFNMKQEQKLSVALASLDERSQDILQNRWLSDNKATLHDLAAKYEVSAERIRQLERQAMLKLKKHIEAA